MEIIKFTLPWGRSCEAQNVNMNMMLTFFLSLPLSPSVSQLGGPFRKPTNLPVAKLSPGHTSCRKSIWLHRIETDGSLRP